MANEVKWLSIEEGTRILKEWGYPHYVSLLEQTKMVGGYDDDVLTRILILRFEPNDTIRFIAYAENNPTSDLVTILEVGREFYGRVPKNVYAICNTVEGNEIMDYLIDNHPLMVPETTEDKKQPSGDRKVAFTR